MSLGYWVKKITDEGQVREDDIEKAAKKAYSLYMRELRAKGVRKARAAKAEREQLRRTA
ncbi:hypothetical protein ACQPYK_08720 [Streptosporangium sp. CA-135522]|uniref:hypothetical protein n=1 Tax=Streptosporangium sp. CA-135522 TaxID=3240072 RepID=UPI003D8F4A15